MLIRKGFIEVKIDEFFCYGSNIEVMFKLKFYFFIDGMGIVILVNVLGINDGVVVVVFMKKLEVDKCGFIFLVWIVFWF